MTTITETQPQTQSYTPRAKNLALLLLAMTQFVIVIDASIVNVALPSIGSHLHFSRDDLSWVVNAYTLTFGGFLLLGGRLADLLGRRRMFMLGLVCFRSRRSRAGSRSREGWLLAARAVQGLGAAIVSPGGAVDHHHHIRRGVGAQPGARGLGRGGGRRAAPRACCSAGSSPAASAGAGCCS